MKMSRFARSKKLWLAAGAMVLAMTMTVGTALAYFTDSTSVGGSQALKLGSTTTTTETVDRNLDKHVVINNIGDTSVYVRVMAVGVDGSITDVTGTVSGEGWTNGGDGYYYYDAAVPAGESTAELTIDVTIGENAPIDFDIVVVHESVQANLEGANNSSYAGWSLQPVLKGGDINE